MCEQVISNDINKSEMMKLTTTVDLPRIMDQKYMAFHYQMNFVHLEWLFETELEEVVKLGAAENDDSEVVDVQI
jgi:predicted transport protein